MLQVEPVHQSHVPDTPFSTFGSVDLPHIDNDSFVPAGERGDVVTSRLGRRSVQSGSRCASTMSNDTDDIGTVI